MSSFHIDRAVLTEPNLWVPGRMPVGPVKIDWSHPLTKGLVTGAISAGSNVHNLTEGRAIAAGTSDVWQGEQATKITAGRTISTTYPNNSQSAKTIWIVGAYYNNWNTSDVLSVYPPTYNGYLSIYYGGGGVQRGVRAEPTTLWDGAVGGAQFWPLNDFAVHSGASIYLYSFGGLKIAGAASPTPNTDGAQLRVLNPFLGSGEYLKFKQAFWWDRALSFDEVRLLTNDPYQFLIPA